MKSHSPTRTYNPGDRCKFKHTLNGRTQEYIMESISTYRGEFSIAYFNNKSPRVWRLNSLDINGFVYPGDTIFVGNNGYKNTTQGIKLVREFAPNTVYDSGNSTLIYAPDFKEYQLVVTENSSPGYSLKDQFPSFSGWSNTYYCYISFLGSQAYVKAVVGSEISEYLRPDTTEGFNRIAFYIGTGLSFGDVFTPSAVESGANVYDLTNTQGDFYYFILTQSDGVVNIDRLPLNTNP